MASDSMLSALSRRDFACKVAVAAAAATLSPAVLGQAAPAQNAPSAQSSVGAQKIDVPKIDIPKEVAAEVEMKFDEIMRLSAPGAAGTFTAEQKDEIRRQLVSQVQGLQKLRAYALDNGDAPATVLRLATPSATREGN